VADTTGNEQRRIRLIDVARIAGVAPITVSRALREPGKVAGETLARIAAAVAETGYVPDLVASSLTSRRSRLIGVIIPTVTASVYAATVAGISDALRGKHFQSLLGNSGYDLDEEARLVAAFLGRRADGIVLSNVAHAPATYRMLRDARVPVVETGNLTDTPIDMVVGFSNYAPAYETMRHLVARGYRRIGFVGAVRADNPQATDRQRAYRQAVADFGLPADPELILERPPSIDEGRKAVATLAARFPDLDAVFAAGEVWAIGALLECQHRGWPVPSRLAIASYNDADLAAHLVPALTTTRMPRYEIGRRAASMILQRLAGQPVEERIVDVGFELVVRGST
jgi:LacI family gluconate utilization system Gnt-I transcriptional repressor